MKVGYAPEQQQQEQMMHPADVYHPEPDTSYLWWSGVIVPVLVVLIPLLIRRKRNRDKNASQKG